MDRFLLEQIDLSLWGQQDDAYLAPDLILSEVAVLSILLSMIDKAGNQLRQLELGTKAGVWLS